MAKHQVQVVLFLLLTCAGSQAAIVLIDFDSLPGMVDNPGTQVPLASRLSTGLFPTTGALFSSAAGYVAVVDHSSRGVTVSMPNVIAGVNASGVMSFATDVTISFCDPSNSAVEAVTDSVSIRGDLYAQPGATATMRAFNAFGTLLGSTTAPDSGAGLTLTLSLPGIHSVILSQDSANGVFDGTIGFDNLMFNSVTAVPEPSTSGLLILALALFRARRGAAAAELQSCNSRDYQGPVR